MLLRQFSSPDLKCPTLYSFMLPADLHVLKSVGGIFFLGLCFLKVCLKKKTTWTWKWHPSLLPLILLIFPTGAFSPCGKRNFSSAGSTKKTAVIHIMFFSERNTVCVVCVLGLHVRSYPHFSEMNPACSPSVHIGLLFTLWDGWARCHFTARGFSGSP